MTSKELRAKLPTYLLKIAMIYVVLSFVSFWLPDEIRRFFRISGFLFLFAYPDALYSFVPACILSLYWGVYAFWPSGYLSKFRGFLIAIRDFVSVATLSVISLALSSFYTTKKIGLTSWIEGSFGNNLGMVEANGFPFSFLTDECFMTDPCFHSGPFFADLIIFFLLFSVLYFWIRKMRDRDV